MTQEISDCKPAHEIGFSFDTKAASAHGVAHDSILIRGRQMRVYVRKDILSLLHASRKPMWGELTHIVFRLSTGVKVLNHAHREPLDKDGMRDGAFPVKTQVRLLSFNGVRKLVGKNIPVSGSSISAATVGTPSLSEKV
jgi:hypothetical protein